MRILVIGSGGREHTLAWKLRQSPQADRIFCAPGNAGTGEIAENVAIPVSDLTALVRFAKENRVELTVVGPDDPLAAGIVDLFTSQKLRVFGPDKSAARIESSKIFAKELMRSQKIPTAEARTFSNSERSASLLRAVKISDCGQGGWACAGQRRCHRRRCCHGKIDDRRHDESSPFRRRWPADCHRRIFAAARNARCMPWWTEKTTCCWNRRAITSGHWTAIRGQTQAEWALSAPPTIGTPNPNGGSTPKS